MYTICKKIDLNSEVSEQESNNKLEQFAIFEYILD